MKRSRASSATSLISYVKANFALGASTGLIGAALVLQPLLLPHQHTICSAFIPQFLLESSRMRCFSVSSSFSSMYSSIKGGAMNREEEGRFFRDAWIAGVRQYYPGTPKSGYITPWEEMQEWEQLAATATYQQVRQFVLLTNGSTQRLTKEQKGRFVCLC